MKKISIIGTGGIAKHLQKRLAAQGHHAWLTARRNNEEFRALLKSEQVQAVFVAISTLDKGEAARDYILACIEAGIPVITCEKGALAYHAKILKPHLSKIGFSATVGGGTRILKYVKDRNFGNKQVEIHTVINGTLNFIFDEIRNRGSSLYEACEKAHKLGYTEPGATDPLSLINGELKDVRMKTCVFFNTVLATNRILIPDEFGLLEHTVKDLGHLGEEGGDHRFVVSFSNYEPKGYHNFGKQFGLHFIDGWHITGSFRRITQASQLSSWIPRGVGNAVHIIEGELGSGGEYTLSGPGAGHEPTTSAMLADFEELCR